MPETDIDLQFPYTWPNPPEHKNNQAAVFRVAVDITLEHEGGYILDPDDPGGETRFGISKRSYPDIDIADLTREDARKIYFLDFWCAPKFDRLALIAPDLAIRLFDLGVNCGPQTAVKFLQRGVNAVCKGVFEAWRASAWRQKIARMLAKTGRHRGLPLRVDGMIGKITLGVVDACPHESALMAALKGEAYNYYIRQNPRYIPGWLNRLES